MSRKRLISYAIGIILMIALLTVCLVARGRPSVTPATALEKGKQTIVASPTISRTNEQPTATSVPLAGTSGQSMATTPTAGSESQCGNVNLSSGGNLIGPANAQQEKNCFWQAYQQCLPASLMLTITGTDVVSSHTFSTTQKQGSCVVSDTVLNSVVGQPSGQQDIYNCARLENTETGLHFVDCGDEGTIDIPSS